MQENYNKGIIEFLSAFARCNHTYVYILSEATKTIATRNITWTLPLDWVLVYDTTRSDQAEENELVAMGWG